MKTNRIKWKETMLYYTPYVFGSRADKGDNAEKFINNADEFDNESPEMPICDLQYEQPDVCSEDDSICIYETENAESVETEATEARHNTIDPFKALEKIYEIYEKLE